MTDYADLEKRLREEARMNRADFAMFAEQYADLVTEAADALAFFRAELDAMHRTEHEAITFQVDAWRERVLEVIEPFAEMGEGLTYDKDGVWRRRHHGRVDNLGRDVEITFTEGELFERIAALKQDLSRARSDSTETEAPAE